MTKEYLSAKDTKEQVITASTQVVDIKRGLNVRAGKATLIWVKELNGWVLPGGAVITLLEQAKGSALLLDAEMKSRTRH